MHVLASAKIPVARLPIDLLISNAVAFNRKNDRKTNAQTADESIREGKMASTGAVNEKREALEKEAIAQGLVMLPEYQFDHCVYQMSESSLQEEGLTYGYNKCMNFLRLKQRPDVGLTVLISPKWMFVGVLTAPYCINSNECPVFLDGFSFAGLVSLQTVEKTWPATAGLERQECTVMEAI